MSFFPDRKKLLPIWEKAVKFIEANESRIRVESQAIQGEEFLVWKWLPVRFLVQHIYYTPLSEWVMY